MRKQSIVLSLKQTIRLNPQGYEIKEQSYKNYEKSIFKNV